MKSNFAPPLSPTLSFNLIAFSLVTLTALAPAYSQTATYHLHREASPTAGRFQLNTPQPESAILAVQSAQLRNQGAGEYLIKEFDSAAANLPGIAGAIPSGSTVSVLLWMRKTDTFGTLFPRAKLLVNSAAGAQLCVATGSAALTITLTPISLTCTTSSQVAMAVNDRFYLWVGTSMTAGPGNKALFAELDIEGTPGGNYDSLITVPLPVAAPAVSGLTPASGGAGTSVTIAGSGFGATQGSSTVTFNGTAATPTSWSASSIAAPVPSGASTGPVVVRVGTLNSNGVTFTVQAGTVSGTVTRSSDSVPFAGVLVEALQGGLVMASGTSGAGGAFTIPGLGTGSYDVRATLNGYNQATNSNVAVTIGATVTSNFNLVRGGPIQYVYDELSRLSAVLDRNGDSARYRYDAVGNVAGIDRIGAGTVSILEVKPESGVAGAAITIQGTGFSATPAQNTVSFNGTTAAVTSSTANSLAVTVPAGASSGPITVTTPSGSAISSVFTMVPEVITSGTINGPPVLVTTASAGQRALLTFSGSTGQALGVLLSQCGIIQSDVSVLKPDGSALIAPTLVGLAGGFLEAALPVTGTYTVIIDPRMNYSGSVTVTLHNTPDVSLTGVHGGPKFQVGINLPGQNARIQFSGVAKQHIALAFEQIQIPESDITVLQPDGSPLMGPYLIGAQRLLVDNESALPVTGTYTIVINPRGSSTGTMTMEIVQDLYGTVSIDTQIGKRTNAYGSNVSWSFTGAAGQRISVLASGLSDRGTFIMAVSLRDSSGNTLATGSGFSDFCYSTGDCFLSQPVFMENIVLPANGTYEVYLNPSGLFTGGTSLTINDVTTDVSGSTTVNGPAVDVTITKAGQNGQVTFPGTAGQPVTVRLTRVDACPVTVSLLSPSQVVLASVTQSQCVAFNLPSQVLPAPGTYTVRVDPSGPGTGTWTVSTTNP